MIDLEDAEIRETLTKTRNDVSRLHDRIYKMMLRATLKNTSEGHLLAANLQHIQHALVKAETELDATASFYSEEMQWTEK